MKSYYLKTIKIICLLAALIMFWERPAVAFAIEEQGTTSLQAVAIVEVVDYTVLEGGLEAGKDSTISISLHNTAQNTQINSLMMTMSSLSGAIYPTYGTGNQIYIGTLEPDEKKDASVQVTVNPDFNGKSADLSLKFAYINSGKLLSNTVTIALPILGADILEVKALDMSAHATVNSKALLSLTVLNNSTFDVNDATLVLDGNVTEESKSIRLDTISADKSYSKDCQISFTEVGEQIINVSLEFTDLNNNRVVERIGEYTVNVSDESALKTKEYSGDIQKKLFGRIIALAAAVAAVFLVFVYIKKR